MNVFTKRLKEIRKRKGLSQKKLGIKAGIDEFTASVRMNQYEICRHHPDMSTVKDIADALDVPMAYLFCEDDQLAEMILAYPKLTKQQQRELKHHINFLVPSPV